MPAWVEYLDNLRGPDGLTDEEFDIAELYYQDHPENRYFLNPATPQTRAVARVKLRLKQLGQAQGPSASGQAADQPGAQQVLGSASLKVPSDLVGDVDEGINTRPTHISRASTIDKLLCKVSERGFVLLKGPPRSGKTSLLQLTARMVPQQVCLEESS
eukprot:CAMPEP_0202902720 /NCGR_PEP_ID=MMETSP1392-20130828/17017_1 /ASSEMBLY_ACC=CAM_ASM_000868 /TAXON_ID=225041 /ORGANISM="Chlamydomonas chlamydogama, Strain SAG 11-48b" /LENGTH=157 /DNA_ID=CAMNT_0049589527 /DNA_START=211 /DNA_END=684 /DNA_ORIENTATION=-